MDRPLALELRGVTKRFGAHSSPTTPSTSSCAGRDPRAARRERGRQDDAHDDPLRARPSPTRARSPRRPADRDRLATATRSRSASGWCTSTSCSSRVMTVAENLVLGRRAAPRGPLLDTRRRGARARAVRAVRARGRPGRARRGPLGRPAAARGDPAGALPRRARADPRRADRRAHRRRRRRSCSASCAGSRPRAARSCFISHKLDEVLAVADRITVLRARPQGRHACRPTGPRRRARPADGRAATSLFRRRASGAAAPGEPRARARAAWWSRDDRGLPALRGVSLTVARRRDRRRSPASTATASASWSRRSRGLRRPAAGTVARGGRDVTGAGAARSARRGRRPHRRGPPPRAGSCSTSRSPRTSRCASTGRPPLARRGLLSRRRMRRRAGRCSRSTTCAAARPTTPAAALSGGNQQKVVVARELARRPARRCVAAQPTRGVDVGAIEFVHRRLVEQRDAGRAVLLVSLELDEIRALADRILVALRGPDRRRVPARRERERSSAWRWRAGRRDVSGPARARAGTVASSSPATCAAAACRRRSSPRSCVLRRRHRRRATGADPLSTYKAIFDGTGLNWFFPWVSGDDRVIAAGNLQQTLLLTAR